MTPEICLSFVILCMVMAFLLALALVWKLQRKLDQSRRLRRAQQDVLSRATAKPILYRQDVLHIDIDANLNTHEARIAPVVVRAGRVVKNRYGDHMSFTLVKQNTHANAAGFYYIDQDYL